MARYRQGDGVGSASVCNGANRFRLADARRQGSISDGRPAGDATQRGADPLLEMGAANVERQIECPRPSRDETNNLLEVVTQFLIVLGEFALAELNGEVVFQ